MLDNIDLYLILLDISIFASIASICLVIYEKIAIKYGVKRIPQWVFLVVAICGGSFCEWATASLLFAKQLTRKDKAILLLIMGLQIIIAVLLILVSFRSI